MDSFIGDDDIADLVADLISGDDSEVGLRRRQKKIQQGVKRRLEQMGVTSGGGGGGASSALAQLAQTNPAAAAQVATQAIAQAAQAQAAQSGMPMTAGRFLAASSQRKEVLHLGSVTLAAAAASVAQLSVQVQRAIQTERLVLQCADSTTGADQLFSVGVTNVTLGSHNLLATPGIAGAATAYGANSWYSNILSVPLGQGGNVSVNLSRLAATANPGVVSGIIFGASAQG